MPAALLIGTITSAGTLLLTIAFVRRDKLDLRDVGAAFGSQSTPRFAIGFIVGLILIALHVLILAIGGGVTWIRSPSVAPSGLALPLLTYILLACREELAFRGYPLRRLNSFYGLWIAQIILAIIFALEHVAGGTSWTTAFLGTTVGSLLFGMAAIATDGIAVPIGIHAAWNFGDWLHGGKDSTGLWTQTVPAAPSKRAELAGMLGYLVIMLGATLASWLWYRSHSSSRKARDPALEKNL